MALTEQEFIAEGEAPGVPVEELERRYEELKAQGALDNPGDVRCGRPTRDQMGRHRLCRGGVRPLPAETCDDYRRSRTRRLILSTPRVSWVWEWRDPQLLGDTLPRWHRYQDRQSDEEEAENITPMTGAKQARRATSLRHAGLRRGACSGHHGR